MILTKAKFYVSSSASIPDMNMLLLTLGVLATVAMSIPTVAAQFAGTVDVDVNNSAAAGSQDLAQPITRHVAGGDSHFYIFSALLRSVELPWQDARDVCSNETLSHGDGGCYLNVIETPEEASFLSEYLASGDYNTSLVWTNFYVENGTIINGLTNESASYPQDDDDVYFLQYHDALVLAYENGSLTFIGQNTSVSAPYVCECDDICQPGVQACLGYSPCCEQGFEVCTAIDNVTAACSCSQGNVYSDGSIV